MNEQEKIAFMRRIAAQALLENKDLGQYLLQNGIEPVSRAKWIRSTTREMKNSYIYICSGCSYYKKIKKMSPEQIKYIKYCPRCGSRMEV